MPNVPEKWPSLEGGAERLGVSEGAIRNWIKEGAIPHRRIGEQFKFRVSEVGAWVGSGKSAEIVSPPMPLMAEGRVGR
jgi:excisionase family DNA binding protein